MTAAARVDKDYTQCDLDNPTTPPEPHVGGQLEGPGAPTVKINKSPAALEGDTSSCIGADDTLLKGSTKVLICNKSPARKDDKTAHGATIMSGSGNVNIGDTVQGAALKKAGAPLVQICTDPNAPEMA